MVTAIIVETDGLAFVHRRLDTGESNTTGVVNEYDKFKLCRFTFG